MALIRVENVGKSFASRHGTMSIMEGITFDVKDADFLAIVGPSGCGKSTLLRLIQGLDHPTSGPDLLPRTSPSTACATRWRWCSRTSRSCRG